MIATSMLDFGVGRTKRSAVPAIARDLPEQRFAWSGLQTQSRFLVLTTHSLHATAALCVPYAGASHTPYAGAIRHTPVPDT